MYRELSPDVEMSKKVLQRENKSSSRNISRRSRGSVAGTLPHQELRERDSDIEGTR